MALTETEKAALTRFRDTIAQSLDDNTVEVTLFGSKARGDDKEDSDIDVLVVVSSDDWRVCDKVYAIATDMLLDAGVSISPKVISRRQYEYLLSEGTPFIRDVMRDGVPV